MCYTHLIFTDKLFSKYPWCKMKALWCGIFLLYLVNIHVDVGSAISCYSCNATAGMSIPCVRGNSTRVVGVTNCNACMQVRINTTIIRACVSEDDCDLYQDEIGFIYCEICSTDFCNGG